MDSQQTGARVPCAVLGRYGDLVEVVSATEAYLDVTRCALFGGSVTLIARDLRRAVEDETGLTASVGAAPNKFLARVAARRGRPNGQVVVRAVEVADFVRSLPVDDVWGVGKTTAKKMRELGLNTCADVQAAPEWQLKGWFGSRAAELADLAHGRDERPVEPRTDQKSLSVEETFAFDLTGLKACLGKVPGLLDDLEARLGDGEYASRVRGLFVKVKFHDLRVTTHEVALSRPPRPGDFEPLVARAWERREEPVRLLGIGVRLAPAEEITPSDEQLSFTL